MPANVPWRFCVCVCLPVKCFVLYKRGNKLKRSPPYKYSAFIPPPLSFEVETCDACLRTLWWCGLNAEKPNISLTVFRSCLVPCCMWWNVVWCPLEAWKDPQYCNVSLDWQLWQAYNKKKNAMNVDSSICFFFFLYWVLAFFSSSQLHRTMSSL